MKKEILIIEDEKIVSYFLETRLKKDDFGVEVALDGQEAMRKIHHKKYDLILTDMMIPNISGLELIMKIKRSGLNLKTPILVLSSLSSADLIVDVLSSGVNDYITKPFSIKVLMAKIHQLLDAPVSVTN
ncbi:response regulator transcription factor [Pedobacter ureilyticus]|uniref:Response regulator transcription factor n=1 Tax=Pedobacter ureilyticus TaxID=1393051 RepID=A0ABW9J9R6_9SPHI|nr:response regulator [Pedobacter helvus]